MRSLSPAVLTARIATVGIIGVVLLAACSGAGLSAVAPGPAGSDGGADASPIGNLGTDAGTSSVNAPGSSCSQPTETVACWTGLANLRHVGACHDGVQTCSSGELPTWSPCIGEVLACGQGPIDAGAKVATDAAACAPLTGGTGSAGGVTQAPPCVPGSSRWCDDGSCYWGKQQCQGDGTWGDCNDTPGNAGPSGCPAGDINYDENCCEQSDQCCAHAVGGNNYGSVGNCSQVDPCACQQLCAQGAKRWCDLALPDNDGEGTWGQQLCGVDGTWGACAGSASAPSGCSSGGSFDQSCCISSGECCEVFDTEGSDPISLNCPATACSTQWSSAGDEDAGDYAGGNPPGANYRSLPRSLRTTNRHSTGH